MLSLRFFKPDAVVTALEDIDWAAVWEKGVRGILVDLDNTLVPWKHPVSDIPARVYAWLEEVQTLGFLVCLISNGTPRRVDPFAKAFSVRSVSGAGKPQRRAYRRAASVLALPPDQCVAVGDQLLTDILGAKRAGMAAYLVKPISGYEFFGTRINRVIEGLLLWMMGVSSRASAKSEKV